MDTQTELGHNLLSSDHTIRVQIGEACCSLSCNDEEIFSSLQQLYSNFLSDKPADISVELKFVDRLNPAEIEATLPETRFIHEGNRFKSTNLIIAGEHDLTRHTLRVTVEKHLCTSGFGFNWMNRLLSIAYYTVCKLNYNGNPPAFLVHSCGILRSGQALLFAGPCDSGKTTIAQLCDEEYGQVLNDEMLLVSRPHQDNGGLNVQGVPIIGGLPQRLRMTAPLSAVLLLKQGKKTSARRLNRTEAYLRFLRQIAAPAYIGQRSTRAIYSLMADFSDEVTRVAPFYELEFAPDKESLWEAVAGLEKSLG
jgi:hypothetical protein